MRNQHFYFILEVLKYCFYQIAFELSLYTCVHRVAHCSRLNSNCSTFFVVWEPLQAELVLQVKETGKRLKI